VVTEFLAAIASGYDNLPTILDRLAEHSHSLTHEMVCLVSTDPFPQRAVPA
jgi:hypothetical protein